MVELTGVIHITMYSVCLVEIMLLSLANKEKCRD
nr:MAG TPA: hypothetical protein [Bacteriophage sp.]